MNSTCTSSRTALHSVSSCKPARMDEQIITSSLARPQNLSHAKPSCDVSNPIQSVYRANTPSAMAREASLRVWQDVGLHCSVSQEVSGTSVLLIQVIKVDGSAAVLTQYHVGTSNAVLNPPTSSIYSIAFVTYDQSHQCLVDWEQ